jgi:uncharacterized membrane protein YqaE (UPF0057 family)
MKILSVLRIKNYKLIAIFAAIAMALVYPYLQVALNGGFFNYFFWFEVLLQESILNAVLYLAFSVLFGLVVSLSIYNWKNRTCSIKGGVGSGGAASLLGIFTSQCSACLSLASLFLPITAVGALAVYNTVFNFISIGVLLLSLYMMGGFKK